MAFGGFKTVDLNAVGWGAVLGTGGAAGLVAAWTFGFPSPAGLAVGVVLSYGVARGLDEVRDRGRRRYVPVANAEDAATKLREARIRTRGTATAVVNGRRVEYVAVRERDAEFAASAVGLPHESRRAQRRWLNAQRAARQFTRER